MSLKRLITAVGIVVAAAWAVDAQGGPPGGAFVAHRWVHELPDPDGYGGKQSSLAFDSQGNPYVSYWHTSTRGFRVAYRDARAWVVDAIEVTDG